MWLFILLYGISFLHTVTAQDTLTAEQTQAIDKKILEAHNKYREHHGVGNLTWDSNLAKEATEWAQHLASINSLEPKKMSDKGQNLWIGSGNKLENLMDPTKPNENPVKSWYDEMRYYPGIYRSNLENETGEFTQLIWKSTKKVGCGFKASSDKTFVVCFYEPKGNVMGDSESDTILNFSHNVLPPKGESWDEDADNSLSWWFVILIFVCVAAVGGWRIYRRREQRRRRRRSSVKPGAGIRRVSGARPGPSVKPAAGVKPTSSSKSATTAKPATTRTTKAAATTKPATRK